MLADPSLGMDPSNLSTVFSAGTFLGALGTPCVRAAPGQRRGTERLHVLRRLVHQLFNRLAHKDLPTLARTHAAVGGATGSIEY